MTSANVYGLLIIYVWFIHSFCVNYKHRNTLSAKFWQDMWTFVSMISYKRRGSGALGMMLREFSSGAVNVPVSRGFESEVKK